MSTFQIINYSCKQLKQIYDSIFDSEHGIRDGLCGRVMVTKPREILDPLQPLPLVTKLAFVVLLYVE